MDQTKNLKKNNVFVKSSLIITLITLITLTLLITPNSYAIHEENTATNINILLNSVETLEAQSPCLHLFVLSECPQCHKVIEYVEQIKDDEIKISIHDINENKELYDSFKKTYSLEKAGFPILFMGNKYIIGEAEIINTLNKEIHQCQAEGCECPLKKAQTYSPGIPKTSEYTPEEKNLINIPGIGTINLEKTPLIAFTILIAAVDGFNPCSLWVLTFLLGIVVYTKSRKKILLVGGTFLLVTATAYGLFMTGLLNVFSYIGYTLWIKMIVSLLALTFAVVNIKDYFWYKKGISFTIPDKYKPKLFKNMRGILHPENSMLTMIASTAVMALGVTLVELPCTAGLPMIWTSELAKNNITGMSFFWLLILYLLIYLVIEIIIILSVMFTLKTKNFEEKHGRILKLVGGMIMLALAYALLFQQEAMNSIKGSIAIFGTAILVSIIIIQIHKHYQKKTDNENKKENNKKLKKNTNLETTNKPETKTTNKNTITNRK